MTGGYEYRFEIDAYTRDTLPMWRLAEYMADLAVMLGEPESVHFMRVDEGSAVLVQAIDEPAVPKVRERTRQIRSAEAPPEAMTAYRRTNRRLKADNAVGVVKEETGAEVIRFPGREQPEPLTFGSFNQEGSLDGIVIRLGGTGDPVPVHIETPNHVYSHCLAKRELAKTLGGYIFDVELRVHGTGRWSRDENGMWVLERFMISSFEVLDSQPLSAVVARLRDIPGSEWPTLDDPWHELSEIRNRSDEPE